MESFNDSSPFPFKIIHEGVNQKGVELANVPAKVLLDWYDEFRLRLSPNGKKLKKYIEENKEILEQELNG